MKNICLFLVFGLALITNCQSLADLSAPANVNLTGTGQYLWNQQVNAKTNIDRGGTNYTYASRSSTTNFVVNAEWLLNRLANSFNTNFPPGSKLLLCGGTGHYYFAVSDGTGTNILLVPDQVISSSSQGRVFSGVTVEATPHLPPSIVFSGTASKSFTTWILFQYDDSAMNTEDGKHSSFSWSGRVETKASHDIATGFTTENVRIYLTGGGQFPSPYPVSFTGTIRAKLNGVEPFP